VPNLGQRQADAPAGDDGQPARDVAGVAALVAGGPLEVISPSRW